MLRRLADRLEEALPDHVEVERGGLRRAVRSMTVRLEPEQLRIDIKGSRLAPILEHVVRGVCVRTQEITIDEWLEKLGRGLAKEAMRSTEIRVALEEALR